MNQLTTEVSLGRLHYKYLIACHGEVSHKHPTDWPPDAIWLREKGTTNELVILNWPKAPKVYLIIDEYQTRMAYMLRRVCLKDLGLEAILPKDVTPEG